MSDKIFADVKSATDLANILVCLCEDDLVKYDQESRRQFCAEIRALCRKFSIGAPKFTDAARLEEQQALYDEQAEIRGIEPQAPIDYLNEELDANFASFEDFRTWCEAAGDAEDKLTTAKALAEPNDEEMNDFLSSPGEGA